MSRDALAVGINQYQNLHSFKTAAQDAEAVADLLSRYGKFRVQRFPEQVDPFDGSLRVSRKQEVSLTALKEALVKLFKPEGQHVGSTSDSWATEVSCPTSPLEKTGRAWAGLRWGPSPNAGAGAGAGGADRHGTGRRWDGDCGRAGAASGNGATGGASARRGCRAGRGAACTAAWAIAIHRCWSAEGNVTV